MALEAFINWRHKLLSKDNGSMLAAMPKAPLTNRQKGQFAMALFSGWRDCANTTAFLILHYLIASKRTLIDESSFQARLSLASINAHYF